MRFFITILCFVLLASCGKKPVDPRDYGAICDRKHDDSEAFEKAFQAPDATSRGIILPPNCVVQSRGLIIKQVYIP